MIKKVIDTNIFIDRFSSPDLYRGVFLSSGIVYLSSTGEIISKLQVSNGYNIKKSASITNDCLIAASVRSMGATLYTKNKKDFMAIQDVFHFKVMFV